MTTMTKAKKARTAKKAAAPSKAAKAVIQVRVDAKTKDKAEKLFKRHGLSTSDGVRRLIDSAIKDGDPWLACKMSSHIPNAETEAVLRDALAGRNMEPMTSEEFHKFLEEA